MSFAPADSEVGPVDATGKEPLFSSQKGKLKKRPQTSTGETDLHSERPTSGRSVRDYVGSSYSRAESAQHAAALDGARKLRIDKFQSRFTFSHRDPKYYSDLPAQPATGWWKALIKCRRQSPGFVDRLCRYLDILLPDTIYTTSTECYYFTNNPAAFGLSNARTHELAFSEAASHGWLIKEDFSVSKLFERNAAYYLASAGFPSGQMKRKPKVRQTRSGSEHVHGTTLVPAAVVKQPHYAAANKNITKALDLPNMSALLADSSSERLVQVSHFRAKSLLLRPYFLSVDRHYHSSLATSFLPALYI